MSNKLITPYFLIHEENLEQNILSFKKALSKIWSNSIIAYSVKTNSLPWLLAWMNKHDVYAEVVSDEEFELAILSGYKIDRIVFNGPIKSNDFINRAFSGAAVVNIDSKHEIEYVINHKSEINSIGFRVNVNPGIFNTADVEFQEEGFRFGFSYENGELKKTIKRITDRIKDVPIGLHLHVNSITRSLDVYRAIAHYAVKIITECELDPDYIDVGGGFFGGVPGKPTPEEYISVIRNELESVIDVSKTKLIIEPGSAAIGSAIELHTSVIDVKDTVRGRIVTTDGSRVLIDPLWKKKNYYYSIDSKKNIYKKQVICGYTCMDHDRIMIIEDSPELTVGDHIIYHRVGNYTVTFGGPFIKPFPCVYVKNEKGIQLVRKQMTMEEYYRMETV